MALNIEGASIGFDANNVQKALNNLKTGVIQDTITLMQSGLLDLYTAVNDAWVGASAEQFKKNMNTDMNKVSNALSDTYDILVSEMDQIINAMKAADEELVKGRDA